MREQQFIRFVEQICFLLKLSQPCSKTALQYFLQFKEYENHGYDQEILVAACIYLSVKIFQEEVRIRDILNMIYVLTSLYKMSAQQAQHDRENQQQKFEEQKEHQQKKVEEKPLVEQTKQIGAIQQECQQNINQPNENQPIPQTKHCKAQQQQEYHQQPYILLKNIQHIQNLHQLIQPKYSLSDYNQYKGKIIQAQQTLLRILGFSFSLSQQNKKQLKRLLIVIHHMRISPTIAQTIIKVYNDLHYIDIDYWPEGVVYFGFLITKVFVQEKQHKKQGQTVEIDQNLELREFLSTGSQKKTSDKQTAQLNRIKQFTTLMTNKKWQSLLSTDIKQLQNYAQKLTIFYSSILTNS